MLPLHREVKLDAGLLRASSEQVLYAGGHGLFLAKTVILGESSNMLGVRVWTPPGLVFEQFVRESAGLLFALLVVLFQCRCCCYSSIEKKLYFAGGTRADVDSSGQATRVHF